MRTPLPPAIESSQALLSLASALEREAAKRYRDLAERMVITKQPELETLFGFLATLEDRHGEQLAQSIDALKCGSPVRPASNAAWEVPENFDEEAARSAALSPYAALAIAVRNEERAFAFYCHAAAAAASPTIRSIAEDLARDELQHASLLRHARRAAFRREGRHDGPRNGPDMLPQTIVAFRMLADEWRAEAAGYHWALADALEGSGQPDLAEAFRKVASEEHGDVRAEGACLKRDGPFEARGGIRVIEALFERFADIAGQTGDAMILTEAQSAAESCVRWLALVGGASRNEMII